MAQSTPLTLPMRSGLVGAIDGEAEKSLANLLGSVHCELTTYVPAMAFTVIPSAEPLKRMVDSSPVVSHASLWDAISEGKRVFGRALSCLTRMRERPCRGPIRSRGDPYDPQAKKPYVDVEFSDADHGFLCDHRPTFDAQASALAWGLTSSFLAIHLR